MFQNRIGVVVLLCVVYIRSSHSVSFEEDMKITGKQAEILAEFRNRILPKLPHKYMEENIFLVRWLRARSFNVDKAEEMLLKHIQWRKSNKVDHVDSEDWQQFEAEYPWLITGTDKRGRPVVELMVREWDLRKAAVTGRMQKVTRWSIKFFEDATKLVRKLQESGRNVTQFVLIIDTEGFNPVTHGCPMCIPYFLTMARIYEEQYPAYIDKVNIVNTPEFFRVILGLMWPILSDTTKRSLKIYGTDRNTWRKALAQDIDRNQLLKQFGGTKEFS